MQEIKKAYKKPEITRIKLTMGEAILTTCSTTATRGNTSSGATCRTATANKCRTGAS